MTFKLDPGSDDDLLNTEAQLRERRDAMTFKRDLTAEEVSNQIMQKRLQERLDAWSEAMQPEPPPEPLRTLKIVWRDDNIDIIRNVSGEVRIYGGDWTWFHVISEQPHMETWIRSANVLRMELTEAEPEASHD